MMNHVVSKLLVAALLLSSLSSLGCEQDDGTSALKMRLELYTPPMGYPDPFAGVGFLRIIASGTGIATRDVFVEYGSRAGELASIPYGDDVQLTVESYATACVPRTPDLPPEICVEGTCDDPAGPCAYAPSGVVGRGRTPRLDISKSSDPRALAILMMELESYAPTTSASSGAATSLATGRVGHSVTELEDGRVLIVGGASLLPGVTDFTSVEALGNIYATAEIYDPSNGEFFPVAAPLSTPRAYHQAVRLPDASGQDRVAIFGGYSDVNGVRAAVPGVEIFDPVSGTFSQQVLPMLKPRAYHTATLLDDEGQVLLVGGRGEGAAVSWELWHPVQGPTKQGGLSVPRWNHTATAAAAPSGGGDYIYLMGGENDTGVVGSAEIFSSVEEILLAGVFSMKNAGTLHTTSFVAGQRHLYVIGGYADVGKTQPMTRVDVFQINCDAAAQGLGQESCWRTDVPFSLSSARGGHQTTQLPGNVLLITGGAGDFAGEDPMVALSEVIYQEGSEVRLIPTRVDPIWARVSHQALALSSQRVFLSGGARKVTGAVSTLRETELFNPR